MANAKDKLEVNIHLVRERLSLIDDLTNKYALIDKPNYGHIGDLGYINGELMKLVQFLGGKGRS